MHPLFIIYTLEYFAHKYIKILIICTTLTIFIYISIRVCNFYKLVKNSHDEIIILSILSIFKSYITCVKEIISNNLSIIDLFKRFIKFFVNFIRCARRIFSAKIWKNILLQNFIYVLIELRSYSPFIFLSELSNIFKNVLTAINLELMIVHLFLLIVFES